MQMLRRVLDAVSYTNRIEQVDVRMQAAMAHPRTHRPLGVGRPLVVKP